MKIFVSFSSDDRDQVEPIVEALRGAGHTVFYDQTNLPPGDTYDQQIEKAVKSCDAMVYCLSGNSVRPGVYSLTELKFAREKWPSARNRVLPVMLEDMSFDDVPAYLKAVTVLRPDGNAAAETVSAVSRVALAQRRKPAKWIFAGGVGLAAVAGFLFLPGLGGNGTRAAISGETISPSASVDIFDPRPAYEVSGTYRNPDREIHYFNDVEMEFSPEIKGVLFERDLDQQEVELIPGKNVLFRADLSFGGPVPDSQVKWRLGLAHESGTAFGEWRNWEPTDFDRTFEIWPEEMSNRYISAIPSGDGFAILYRNPSELVLGDRKISVSGRPMAMAVFDNEVAVATMNPPEVAILKDADFAESARFVLPRLKNEFEEPVSTAVSRLAFTKDGIWVTTDSSSGASGILYLNRITGEWSLAPFDPIDSPDPEDLILKTSDSGVVAGVSSATIPTSVYLLSPEKLITYGGHDFDDASSATDFAWIGSDLLLRTDEGTIVICRPDGDRLLRIDEGKTINRSWESVHQRGDWPSYLIGGTLDACFLAINKRNADSSRETEIVFATRNSTRTILHQKGAETLSMCVNGKKAIALLEDESESRRVVEMRGNSD